MYHSVWIFPLTSADSSGYFMQAINPTRAGKAMTDHREGAACGRGSEPRPRAGTFARAGVLKKAQTATRFATPALLWRWCAQNPGRRPIEKARGRFPGAGSNISAMLNL
jgi:hypothetical protein